MTSDTTEGILGLYLENASLFTEGDEYNDGDDFVKLMSIHSAKGLESPCVLSYNIRAYNDEEARLCYVSATRAKNLLIWARTPKKKKAKAKTFSWE